MENQRFKNMQQANPFLMQFKSAQESMEWHRKQKAKEQEQLKTFLSSRKKNSDTEVSDNDVTTINNNYVATLYQSSKYKKWQRELDIKKIFDELYKTNTSNNF
ncbi:hypothetical protein [Spiroplasma endosymbiont of 'Nebria riversi']|uniref:hypothetical protein n=1 Tax=Spiroplasma endosymbiont of 'Nebria riversi' TaxID=2792084 RepID=UPI001C0554F0|nr:hypothetical protein [Spiroplasma endosymbiont of 'Nebria riversi']